MVVTSKTNATVKKFSALAEKKFRKEYGEFLVESIKAVDECQKAGFEITRIVCTSDLQEKYPAALVVSDEIFSKISTEKTPQGVIASVKLPCVNVVAPTGSCLLLDRIQDPGNLGTIIRTANAAGYDDVYLINCTDPFSPKAIRASMGGVFYVGVHCGNYDEVFGALDGVSLITADMNGENVFEFKPPEKYCLCIGNEGNGVSEQVLSRSDYIVKIPMRDTCESLNAGVSAAIAMYSLKNNKRS